MCAIAGILRSDVRSEPESAEGMRGSPEMSRVLRGMLSAMKHRGPDGDGVYFDGPIAFGHRRLAILDLSESGGQPMLSRDGRWAVVLNGEIFNYVELRSELESAFRVVFRSRSDTEVLLEACAAWGLEKTLQRARGMFAFALWDRHNRKLAIARDRMGEKPLLYYWDGVTFAFASELKALHSFHERRIDASAADAYLALGYVPAPLAVFRNCAKLPAGHLLEIKPGGQPQIRRWWFPERASPAPPPGKPDGKLMQCGDETRKRQLKAGQLREKLAESVRLRLRSDAPVALFLSGGIDSSVIAAECARQGARLEAFTVSFDGDQTDLPYARMVANRLGIPHHVQCIRGKGAVEDLAQIFWHYDEPFADSSALPVFALAKAMRGRAKVVLNGDGGDEAFGGYSHYEYIAAKQLVKAAAAAVGLCDGRGSGRAGIYLHSKSLFRAAERRRLLGGRVQGDPFERYLESPPLDAAKSEPLKSALWIDRHLHLANGLNYKTDIALGACGIEGRAPFLDHELLEWAQGLPAADLVRGREKKVLLREAYACDLPGSILKRRKHGFGAPIESWMVGPLQEVVRESVPCSLFDQTSSGQTAQQESRGQRLWALAAFSIWARYWKATW